MKETKERSRGRQKKRAMANKSFAFREDPLHFFYRKYPSDEPHEPNKELRKSLNEDTIGLALHIHEALMQFAGADYAASKADVLHDTLNLLFQGNEPTTGMDRMAFAAPSPGREDKKHVAILRACHRLVNEKVLYRILKSEEGERVESLTKIELAERFSHLSQRPYWHLENIQYAQSEEVLADVFDTIYDHLLVHYPR
jgi:hypothetical protein